MLLRICVAVIDPRGLALKCKEYGEDHFEASVRETSMAFHSFYYSQKLDTCVRETNTNIFYEDVRQREFPSALATSSALLQRVLV